MQRSNHVRLNSSSQFSFCMFLQYLFRASRFHRSATADARLHQIDEFSLRINPTVACHLSGDNSSDQSRENVACAASTKSRRRLAGRIYRPSSCRWSAACSGPFATGFISSEFKKQNRNCTYATSPTASSIFWSSIVEFP